MFSQTIKSAHLKFIQYWFGSILSIIGVIFVAIKLSEYGGQIAFFHFTSANLLGMFGLAMVCAIANLLLALSWKTLLQHLGVVVNFAWAIRTYGVLQIAKYVPGNIFHLAGRQAIGQAAGLPAWPLVKSTVWELSLLAVTGAIFSVLVLPRFVPMVPIPLAMFSFVCVLGVVLLLLRKYIGPPIACAVGLYTAFLSISGLIFTVLLTLLIAKCSIQVLQTIPICGSFVVAWLAGFVTPGAPAGVGIRELVLVLLLKGIVPETDLLLAVVLSRVVTVGGDFCFYLVALVVPTVPIPVNSDY